MDIKNQPKTAKKFECDFCHYKCSKASNWSEHLSTRKHNLLSKGYIKDKKGYINPAGENENSIPGRSSVPHISNYALWVIDENEITFYESLD